METTSGSTCTINPDGGLTVVRWSGWVKTGALLAGLAVALGAVAAHGIDSYLGEAYAGEARTIVGQSIPAAQKYLDDFKTASRYQMAHALGLIAIGALATFRPNRWLSAAGWCHVLGIVMFCGSLYVLALSAHTLSPSARHALGLTAACGGTTFIVGWVLLAKAVCGCGQQEPRTQEPRTK